MNRNRSLNNGLSAGRRRPSALVGHAAVAALFLLSSGSTASPPARSDGGSLKDVATQSGRESTSDTVRPRIPAESGAPAVRDGRAGDKGGFTTVFEKTNGRETGPHDEVLALCERLQQYSDRARCSQIGSTPEGRAIVAIAISDDGVLTADAAHKAKRPVVVVQGGIHAGETDGKDALLLFVRDAILGNPEVSSLLSKVTLIAVPDVNPDGHDKRGPNHRPNQNGPTVTGTRTNGGHLNLNRDYMKVDSPEVRAVLKLLQEYRPIVYVDLHTTDGAQFEYRISYLTQPSHPMAGPLYTQAEELGRLVDADLSQAGHLPTPHNFYPEFIVPDIPASGFEADVARPRMGYGYWVLHNRIGVLVETHSWKPYEQRVRASYDAIQATIRAVATHGTAWVVAADQADEDAAQLGGQKVAIRWGADPANAQQIQFRGVEYERILSPVSGTLRTIYRPARPDTWSVPLYPYRPTLEVETPRAGYVVEAGFAAEVADRLDAHGVSYSRLHSPLRNVAVETFVVSAVDFTPAMTSPIGEDNREGRAPLRVEGEWRQGKHTIPRGSLFVPIAQPSARLVVHLFEPRAEDSFLAWGFFNAAFERKELHDRYVLEGLAEELLERDPLVASEFEQKLAEDADFRTSPAHRLAFFVKRLPPTDPWFFVYPVCRIPTNPTPHTE